MSLPVHDGVSEHQWSVEELQKLNDVLVREGLDRLYGRICETIRSQAHSAGLSEGRQEKSDSLRNYLKATLIEADLIDE